MLHSGCACRRRHQRQCLTNSYQAVIESIESGFTLLEIDFARSADGDWVGTHDWAYWAAHTGFDGALPPTSAQVRERIDQFQATPSIHGVKANYRVLFLDDLLKVLEQHPDVRIITDTKDSATALELAASLKETGKFDRFIFQFYGADEAVQASRSIPATQLIVTTYKINDWWRSDGFGEEFAHAIAQMPGLFAITTPLAVAFEKPKMERLRAMQVPVFVHGTPQEINSTNLRRELGKNGVSGIYVD